MSTTLAGDTDELEALFDSIVAANARAAAPARGPVTEIAPAVAAADHVHYPRMKEPYYSQIGHLTRKLHDTLRHLGLNKSLDKAVDSAISDAHDRLVNIATLSEKAARRVLNATEGMTPLQSQMDVGAANLSGQWDRLLRNELSIEDFKQLVTDTRGFLGTVSRHAKSSQEQLLEIMRAQDVQALTAPIIQKSVEMTKDTEIQLLMMLLQSASAEKKTKIDSSLLKGPVINGEDRAGIVTRQEQVDELLKNLGF